MSQKNAVSAFQHYLGTQFSRFTQISRFTSTKVQILTQKAVVAAAELGHVEAMCCAGSCYMYGKGVGADVVKAVDLYVRAAKVRLCVRACVELAVIRAHAGAAYMRSLHAQLTCLHTCLHRCLHTC
jgi:TPR repeat protein